MNPIEMMIEKISNKTAQKTEMLCTLVIEKGNNRERHCRMFQLSGLQHPKDNGGLGTVDALRKYSYKQYINIQIDLIIK